MDDLNEKEAPERFQAMLERFKRSIKEGRDLSEEELWTAVEQRYPTADEG